MDIELTEGQEKGLKLALALSASALAGLPRNGVICGYAGTGKTTLLKFVLKELGSFGTPILLSPTGKAAARIAEVTGVPAGTIHRWMYEAKTKNGIVTFERRTLEQIVRPASGVIIVDEASMIGPDVWDDLEDVAQQLKVSILLIGDGFQLPPVQARGEEPFSVLADGFIPNPDNRVMLTEILRQAASSPIIRVTMALRESDPYEALMDLDVVLPNEIDDALMDSDMRICRSNKARHMLNARCRQLLGLTGAINAGEPLLVLKNNMSLNVFNGETHTYGGTLDTLETKEVFDYFTKEKATVHAELGIVANQEVVLVHEALDGSLDGKISAAALEKAYDRHQRPQNKEDTEPHPWFLHASYGYVLTAHKSQGSEANRVLVCFEKGMNLTREEDRRWVYTALTRAKERVAVFHL